MNIIHNNIINNNKYNEYNITKALMAVSQLVVVYLYERL